jgi:hypothetical protein
MDNNAKLIEEHESELILLLDMDESVRNQLKGAIRPSLWTVIEVVEKVHELGECDYDELAKETNKSTGWLRGLMPKLSRLPIGLGSKTKAGKVGKPRVVYYMKHMG